MTTNIYTILYESLIAVIYAMNAFCASFIPVKLLGFQDDSTLLIVLFITFISWYLWMTDEDLPDVSIRLQVFVWIQILLPFILKGIILL